MLKIVQAPLPVLSQKADKIKIIDSSVKNLIKEMIQTLESAKDPEGVGLAAPQVGKSLQLFIVKESRDATLQVFINPVLSQLTNEKPKEPKKVKKGKKEEVKLEGCLSLQDVWGVVERYDKVHLSYLDENGTQQENDYDGFFATIVQHEVDHLNGILFPQRVLEQNGKLYKSHINEDGEMEFNEIAV